MISPREREHLIRRAKAVLRRNWTGQATKPAPKLYPHQWSWDSGFIAIGYAHYDQEKAQQELRSLFRGQWSNGLLPHIIFNPKARNYFPGADFWRAEKSPFAPQVPKTSGIVQPPIHATAAWHVYRYAKDTERARTFLEEMFPKLVGWHQYLYRDRDPGKEGLIYIRHPWESGQDNSPIWDRALERLAISPGMIPEYRRVDTSLVDRDERPSQPEYDRYAYLVKVAWDLHYDEVKIGEASHFLIQDVLFNTLLADSDDHLAKIAEILGKDPSPYRDWAGKTKESLNHTLWDEEHGIYFDRDLVSGELIDAHVAAGFLPIYAAAPSRDMARRMLAFLDSKGFCRLTEACWAVPSFDRQMPGFAPSRYWRGPIWLNINWLLYHGLRRYGFRSYAERVREAMLLLPSKYGFYEYFDPDTGRGHGAQDFSWTAALFLDLLLEEDQ